MKALRFTIVAAAVTLVAGALATPGLASEATSISEGALAAKDTIVVQVRNNFGVDLQLYVRYQGGARRNLGIVKTHAVENYTVDWQQGGVWMEVESVLDNRKTISNGLDAPAGAVLVLEVNGDLEAKLSAIEAD